MVKLRDDLDGVVFLNGQAYKAGDEIPEGVRVGGHLTEDGKDYGAPAAAAQPTPAGDPTPAPDPLSESEVEAAKAIDLPYEDLDAPFVRGALAGYAQGHDDGVAETLSHAAVGSAFDLSATIPEVLKYIDENPDETAAILALEAAGEARKGILGEYLR